MKNGSMKKRNRIKVSLCALSIALATLPTLNAQAAFMQGDVGFGSKALHIRSAQADLDVKFQASRDEFAIDEPISFAAEGNKRFYLYVFSVDTEANRGVLIFPNKFDQKNEFPANRRVTVPGDKVQFVADRAGTEKIIVVASVVPVDFDTREYREMGGFKVATAKATEDNVKAIRVRSTEKPADGIVVQELDVTISDKKPNMDARDSASNEPMVFVSADRARYRAGDRVRMMFGADRDATVSLFLQMPNGKRKLLKTQSVKEDTVNHIEAIADAPFGKQSLIVRFDGVVDPSKNMVEKGLTLTIPASSKPAVEAAFPFVIENAK